jgi:hypothetical protein
MLASHERQRRGGRNAEILHFVQDDEHLLRMTSTAFYIGTGVLSTISWMTCSACSDFFRVEE